MSANNLYALRLEKRITEIEAALAKAQEYQDLLIEIRQAKPGGCYFNKWTRRIDAALRESAQHESGKG